MRQTSQRRRKGAVYLVVLMASLVVAWMALSAVEATRWHARDVREEADSMVAQMAADSGFEYAVGVIHNDPNWRTNHTNNVDSSPLTLGNASIRYRLIDPDGSLSDDAMDQCDIIVTADVNGLKYSWRATMDPTGDPLDCLNYAVVTEKDFEIKDFSICGTDQAMASNKKIDVKSNGHLTANCYSTGNMSGNIYGTTNNLANNIVIPGTSAMDYYIANGTTIDLSWLSTSGDYYEINKQLLSATVNSINGSTNPEGIYVIDCQDEKIRIVNSRLQCTLVLIDPKNESEIRDSVHWEAAVPNYPILLTDRELDFRMSQTPLKESTIGVNLNPPGVPFRSISDSTTNTVYPSVLRGLIYINGKVEFKEYSRDNRIQGVLLVNDVIKTEGSLFIEYREIFAANPPPGFQVPTGVEIQPGTVHRVLPP